MGPNVNIEFISLIGNNKLDIKADYDYRDKTNIQITFSNSNNDFVALNMGFQKSEMQVLNLSTHLQFNMARGVDLLIEGYLPILKLGEKKVVVADQGYNVDTNTFRFKMYFNWRF
jgi:hypothetical protein